MIHMWRLENNLGYRVRQPHLPPSLAACHCAPSGAPSGFYVGSGDGDSGNHACVPSAFTLPASLQPQG